MSGCASSQHHFIVMAIKAKFAEISIPSLPPRRSSTTPFSLRNLTPETPASSATADAVIGPGEISGRADVESRATQDACGGSEGSTDARTRYQEAIALVMECENAFTASNCSDETCLAEDYTKRTGICLRRCGGCAPKKQCEHSTQDRRPRVFDHQPPAFP